MKITHRISAILIPLALLTALTACGGNPEAPATPPESPITETITGEHADCPDLAGFWEDIDGSTVELTETGPNQFDAVIGIFRLAEFTGFGRLDVLGVNLTLQDPSGGTLYAQFRPQEDGTCTLTVTESAWELLASGTRFTGFARKPSPAA